MTSWAGVVFAFHAGFAVAEAQSDAYLLERGRAGPVRTGMFVDTVYRRVSREAVSLVDLFREGMFEPAIAVRFPAGAWAPSMVASIREWPCGAYTLQSIEVRDPRFRTRGGIGVGSTVRDVRRAFKDARFNAEEGAKMWVESERMNFLLANYASLDTARVVAVGLVGEDPRVVRQQMCPERGPIP
jgi:hypothetical protein